MHVHLSERAEVNHACSSRYMGTTSAGAEAAHDCFDPHVNLSSLQIGTLDLTGFDTMTRSTCWI
jgi:hypothetical protein